MIPKGYEYARHGATWVRTTQTCWSRADDELEHILRYGTDAEVLAVRMRAASLVASYSGLIYKPRHIRDAVIKALRFADTLDADGSYGLAQENADIFTGVDGQKIVGE